MKNVDIKCILLERYLTIKKDQDIRNHVLLTLYIQIMKITYDLVEEYGVDKVKTNFVELFEDKIIYFDKPDQIQYLIDNDMFDNIMFTNKKLQHEINLKTIVELTDVLQDEIDEMKGNINNTANIIHEEIEELVTTTVAKVEDLKSSSSSFVDKIKSVYSSTKVKFKTIQGNLSHCLGGGKTSI